VANVWRIGEEVEKDNADLPDHIPHEDLENRSSNSLANFHEIPHTFPGQA